MGYKNIDDLLNGLDEKERKNYKKIKRYFGDKNYKENDGKGILHILVDEKHDENKCLLAIRSLIKYGFDVNTVDEFKYNFIQVAMYTGYSLGFVLDIIKLALENGLDVNHKDEDGDTMVHTAIYADDFDENVIEIYKLLLKNGFNSDVKDNDKLDLEQAATKQNQMSKEEIKNFNSLFAKNSSKYMGIFKNCGEIIEPKSQNINSINKDSNVQRLIKFLSSPTKIPCVFENEKGEYSLYNSLAYEIENIEFINLHKKATTKDDIKINKYFFLEPYVYIERKYRDKIKATGKIEDIKDVDEFSYNYLKNLKEIKNMINNNTLNKEVYNSHLNKFINYIKRWISIPDDGYFLEEIQKMFIKIIKGKEISCLSKLNNEKELILLIRGINNLFDTDDFSEEQIRKFNIKQFRVLCKMVDNKDLTFHNKPLILKMLFIFGYDNAKKILKIDNSIGTIEHLVGHVSINNIIINNNGDPVLNKKLFKLLFNGESVLLNAIKNKDSDVYQYFPRIYNEWEAIVYERKNKDIGTIIDYLKSYEIILPPKYYRLQSELEYIGKSAVKIQKAMMFYDQLSKRCYSTIPKVKGSVDEFDYEILDLNDVSSLSIGNKTNCCFSIENVAHFCLLQAISSKNGRILKISKDGNLVAHSWLWRNGNLLCLDNVEVASGITKIDFLNVYLKLADEIMKISNEHEDKNRIKNVTIGYNSRDVKIEGIDAYPYFISQDCNNLLLYGSSPYEGKLSVNKKVLPELPQCLEKYEKNYSDSNKVQYLIKGDGDIKLGEPNYLYQDPRKNVLTYEAYNIYDEEYKTNIKNIINAIAKKEHAILPDEYKKIYCNIDWVILVNEDGSYESYIDSNDKRAYLELHEYEKKLNRKYVDEEKNIKHDIIKTLVS